MNKWGYELVDYLVWVKLKDQKVYLTHGYYFMHSYELCLIGYKSSPTKTSECVPKIFSNVLIAEVRKKSQKPDEMYELIEMMFPNQKKIEIYARNNNLRFGWFSLGNQLG
jgi:N6-adenosine-specific RNA methylase IME4